MRGNKSVTLEKLLIRRIKEYGPVSVAQFMAEALMHPQYGYYQKKQPFGQKGDFITAPEISQIFGELIGIWVVSVWQQMGEPKNIHLVELGPGRGTLMDDILRATRMLKHFGSIVKVHLVEQSIALKRVQQERLLSKHTHIYWHETIETLPKEAVIVVANEFFDALPIHQYIRTEKGLVERVVSFNDQKLCFIHGSVAPSVFNPITSNLKIGDIYEVSPLSLQIMEDIAIHIVQYGGAALCVDYGYEMPASGDTLQSVKNHQYHEVLEDVGEADITAHVNFTALAHVAAMQGACVAGVVNQGDFLQRMGVDVRRDKLLQNANTQQKEQINTAVHRLIAESEMGTLFKVMAITQPHLPTPVGFYV
jgi:NADH dehydrogenase [ubiquinone] 1 alpha subcomplex assembly factor 7